MTYHHSFPSPPPAATHPAALSQPGPVTLALRVMRSALTTPPAIGPVTEAIRTMRAADPTFDLNPDLRALRRALADRIEADLAALDALGGDDEREADNTAYRRQPDGSFATVGFSSDDEPSLCGAGSHPGAGGLWQGRPQLGGNCGGDREDLERDDADDEPSQGSLHGTAAGVYFASQASWAGGARDDREEENEAGGDIQDEPHDLEPDREADHQPVLMGGGGYSAHSFGAGA